MERSNGAGITIRDVFSLLLFCGGGALIGSSVLGVFGGVLGAMGGLALLVLLAILNARVLTEFPGCPCGGAATHFETKVQEPEGIIHRCPACHRTFQLKSARLWYELRAEASPRLLMRRTFLGQWRPHDDSE